MELDTLPCIAGTPAVNQTVFNFSLLTGYSAETSGGLLLSIPQDKAEAYCKELEELDGSPSWIIGRVTKDPHRKAKIMDNVKIIEV
jgi:selenide,water dikinase